MPLIIYSTELKKCNVYAYKYTWSVCVCVCIGNNLQSSKKGAVLETVCDWPRSERCDDAVCTEAVQALLGGHCVLQHVQANGAHQLTV